MEKRLKCVQLLSLKQLAIRKVAVILWSDPDILAAISKFQVLGFDANSDKEWQNSTESKIKDKMSKFELPESLKEQMIDIVEPMGIEIRKWKARHQEYFYELYEENCLPDSAKLYFTTTGMIDYVRTAEELVRCEALLPMQRYRIACLYCLEDHIPFLLEQLSKYWRKDFSSDYNGDEKLSLPYCWPHILSGKLHELDHILRTPDRNWTNINQYAFEHSVETGNKIAAEYFFKKLTLEEREASLMKATHDLLGDPYEDHFLTKSLPDLLCFLLSVMTPEQQMEITKAHPINVLLCFLSFPLLDLFLENSSLIWPFLPPNNYIDLLRKMVTRFSYPGHYVPKLFQQFLILSPPDLKKCFVSQYNNTVYAYHFLCIFLVSEDSGSIKVLFRSLEAADRLRIVFDLNVQQLFCECLLRERWDRVELCLKEVTLSKQDRARMKEDFLGILERCNHSHPDWSILCWKSFCQFVDAN